MSDPIDSMAECGFRIERGSYFIGPCRSPSGHDGRHDPYTAEQRENIKKATVHMTMGPTPSGFWADEAKE